MMHVLLTEPVVTGSVVYVWIGGWGGGGGTMYIPVSPEGSGMPTTRPQTSTMQECLHLRAEGYLYIIPYSKCSLIVHDVAMSLVW